MKKNVLVVFEEIPESKTLYLIKGVSGEDLETILDCHGRYINSHNGNASCNKLDVWITDMENYDEDYFNQAGLTDKTEFGKYSHFKIDDKEPIISSDIDVIVFTGFIL